MGKYIPYEKLSKKKKRERNGFRRGSWGELNPVTRKTESARSYNRKKARKWSDDSSMTALFNIINSILPYKQVESYNT